MKPGLRHRGREPEAGSARRILFPFIGSTVSNATLDAALRLARSQDATLGPACVVVVTPGARVFGAGPGARGRPPGAGADRPRAARVCRSTRASSAARFAPPRAPPGLLERERYDTLVVPARTSTSDGFDPADVTWLLENAPGEVLVLRTGEARERGVEALRR